jgi:hypothetical protein
MPVSILNIPNSFVTFYDLGTDVGRSEYITDTDCGIQKDFCYPIYEVGDVAFQTQIVSSGVISSITVFKVMADGTSVTLNDVIISIVSNGTQSGVPIYNIYFSFVLSNLLDNTFDGDCFTLKLDVDVPDVRTPTFISNQCFKKINDKCLTTKLQYFNNENAFGFLYRTAVVVINPPPAPPLLIPTTNYIRLPLYLKEPIISSTKNVYVRSDGSRKLLSARLAKKYKAFVDNVTEEAHQNIVVALNHDQITLTPENLTNGIQVRFEDEYNNNFPEIMQNVSIWSADFSIFETPFNNFNSNCL